MKVRDSGMPEENYWNSFFDCERILSEMGIDTSVSDLVEIGCGYGTFTIPAAVRLKGNLYGFDIEDEMIAHVKNKTATCRVTNVILEKRDVLTETTGKPENSADYVMLFNILHNESPELFLNEAFRILKPGGKTGIIHWRSDVETPRGPDLSIRPRPEEVTAWIERTGFVIIKSPFIIEPFHFGLVIVKPHTTDISSDTGKNI